MRTSISQEDLLKELKAYTVDHLLKAEKMQELDFSLLSRRPDEYSWSANDCTQHLNMYFDFYLPEIKKRLKNAPKSQAKNFRAGLLGDYFAKSMLPQDALNTMKTLKKTNPLNFSIKGDAMAELIENLKEIQVILNSLHSYNLGRIKTSINISSLIKLKLGDTLRVVIYHNERHLRQAEKALKP
jgi:hypothetical protein